MIRGTPYPVLGGETPYGVSGGGIPHCGDGEFPGGKLPLRVIYGGVITISPLTNVGGFKGGRGMDPKNSPGGLIWIKN